MSGGIIYSIGVGTIGLAIGYGIGIPKSQYWNQDVQIHGGTIVSSPVADVWGYADDWEGCLILAAGANFVNKKELELSSAEWRTFVSEWSTKGNTFCRRNR